MKLFTVSFVRFITLTVSCAMLGLCYTCFTSISVSCWPIK